MGLLDRKTPRVCTAIVFARQEKRQKPADSYLLASFVFVVLCLMACASPVSPLPTMVSPAVMVTPSPMATPLPPTFTPVPTATFTPEPTRCAAVGTMERGVLPSLYAGNLAYRLYLPPCYGVDGRSYPTLYMLPGNTHTDSIWDELGLDEAAEAGILDGSLPPLIIVMADGGWIANNTSGGPGSYETVILAELMPFIESSYCAWAVAEGRAIGGLSRGGYWALEIAFRHPEQFASVGGHSAALLDIAAGPNLNPQHTGLNQELGDLRIYLDIGAQDYLIANIRRLHEDMETAAIPHTWVLNEGQHENAYWSAHVADYLAWYTLPWSLAREAYPPCPP
jgi:enterochelin esterase-like enzyme